MKRIFLAVLAVAAAPMVVAWGQTMNMDMHHGNAAPAAAEDHPPGLGEIMLFQQARHIKLWFAGNAANWPLADHEIDELKEGFDDVNKLLGGDTVEKAVGGPIAALEKAIDGKNRAAFTKAYDTLSAGCNACHQTLNHGFIVIQRPTLQPYTDQVFTPPK
jgi:hypothetical protein